MPVRLDRHNREYPFCFTDFIGGLGLSAAGPDKPWTATQVAGGTGAITPGEANHPGVFQCSSSASANSGMVYISAFTAISLAGGEIAEFIFKLSNLTNVTTRMGFIDTANSADCVDGCYLELPGTGDIVGKTSSNSVRSTTPTLATLVTGTWYRGVIELNADATLVTFSIYAADGTLLGQQTLNTNIPTGVGRTVAHGYISTHSGAAAQALVDMDYMAYYVSRKLIR